MALIITGFDAFGSLVANPAEHVGRKVAYARGDRSFALLPTSYERCAADLKELAAATLPRAVLMLGFAAHVSGVRIERLARNGVTSTSADNDGDVRGGLIDSMWPKTIETLVDIELLAKELTSKGHDVLISDDAGGFVCNLAYFQSLVLFNRIPVLFVHLSKDEAGVVAAVSDIAHFLERC